MKKLLQQTGYALEPLSNIWSRSGYGGIAYSDGDEVEQRIASIISHTSDVTVLSTELRQHCTDWASLYHLSGTRANILRPFENILQGDVLEIGAGCGVITRYLGECGANVLALEGSPRRAAIARSRTRDLENVTVLAEKFDQFQWDHQFDIITLIGVLEYANLFTSGENPALSMLERVHSLLKPKGQLIIAIENQLGLKYFAGALEDHLGQPMVGIEGRSRKAQPQTYGRAILQEKLRKAGFTRTVFMAPFPDYKLPISIVTEAGFNAEDFDASAFAWQSVRRDPQLPAFLSFSPEFVWPILAKNKLALDLSNSFLILSSKLETHEASAFILAWHFSTERVKQCCKQASFQRASNGEIEVRYRLLSTDQTVPILGEKLKFSVPEKAEYAQGKPLSYEFIEIVSRDGWSIEEMGSFFKRYMLIVKSVANSIGGYFELITAETLLPGECFDCIPQNIILDNFGAWRVIDEEWSLLTPISASQLLFRASLSLVNLVSRYGDCASQKVSSLSEFFQVCFISMGFEITPEELESLARQELEIQSEVSSLAINSIDVHAWMNSSSLPQQTIHQALVERNVQISNLNKAITERDNQIVDLNQAVTNAKHELKQVLASKSWQITKPFRFTRRVVVNGSYVATRRILSDKSRSLWRALPISSESKRSLKELLFKMFPSVFCWSKAYQAWNAFNAPVTCAPMNNAHYRYPGETWYEEYVPLIKNSPLDQKPAKLICFYLPQFHTIPENDAWWGEGFTEWMNVQPAQPQFAGHYQPHVPGELGYYNLLDPSVQRRQVELAKLYGIGGFCFYFYWFGGKRLLEAPIETYLNDSSLDLPFCLCWANENWSRRWDGLDSEILIAQQHSAEDDLAFIQYVARYMRDPRYIRIDGKPLLLVYRPSLLPSAKKTAARWRDWCSKNGVGEIYLANTQSFEMVNPTRYGFDAAIEFPPNNSNPPDITDSVTPLGEEFGCTVYDGSVFAERSEHYKQQDYLLLRGVCTSWDNTARRKNRGTVFLGHTPALYQRWLENAISDTVEHRVNPDERLIFINAWNEWAEGAHLEPDARYGYAYLNATLRALLACSGSDACAHVPEETGLRHKSVLGVRWKRVVSLFAEVPEIGLYGYLCDYVALLAQASRNDVAFFLEKYVPCCEIDGEKIVLDRRGAFGRLALSLNPARVFCFVILQYNKVELTERCVASLRQLDQCDRDVRIVIVDNKSCDEVRARTQEAFGSASDVTVLYSDANLGFSAGNNLGYAHAREELGAEFIIILNNDTVIEQGEFISETVELYGQWGFSIAGPDIITPDGRHESPWNDYVYSIEEWESLRSIRCQEREQYLSQGEATFRKIGKSTSSSEVMLNPILQGAAYVVSPIFIRGHEKIFDERLFLYGEEFLLATKCLLSGHLTLYTNKLRVLHHEGATTGAMPSHDKLMFGYDSMIKAISLCINRLEQYRAASLGRVVDFANIVTIDDCLDNDVPNVLVDLLFCQPGYHGGGEYGKTVFDALGVVNAKHGGFQLWVALNPKLFIDPWVWETCKAYAINIVAVSSYGEIVQIVNSDRFDSFFTPAIVVYTGYEYMSKVGSHLPFTCKKTRVIGTLHDIRDFELACNRRQVLEMRRRIGCLKESKMSETAISNAVQTGQYQAEALQRMYRSIIQDNTVDMIVTISSYCENSIKSNIGSPRKPLKVLASPKKRRPTPEAFFSDKFNPTSSPYALLLHAAREEKNVASAVVAFDQLFEESNSQGSLGDMRVVLTGITDLDQLGLAKIQHPDRFIAFSELAPGQFEFLLKHAWFLVYPSLNEGFGYPPVEAMGHGVPSIVSNVTAIPEVCGHAVGYFDPYSLESIKQAIWNMVNEGINASVISNQYNSISEKQKTDLETLVELVSQNIDQGEKGNANSPQQINARQKVNNAAIPAMPCSPVIA